MKKLVKFAAVAALATASTVASAAATYLSTAPNLTGRVIATNFADLNGSFNLQLLDLQGLVTVNVPGAGENFIVSAGGKLELDFYENVPGYELTIGPVGLTPLFTGALAASGLTQGVYNVPFVAGVAGGNDGAGLPVGFTLDYNGATTPGVLALINALLGTSFSGLDGAGSLTVSGSLFSDGAQLSITESNLTWAGFESVLAVADARYGAPTPNYLDANFRLTGAQVAVVPEPASMALVGLGLMGLAAVRRRKSA
ncbi:PEP-CTERM sorting domain-containing protein [Zoogloea sp.]|uniref:PEP-CTERM sorting domain-containing protein n=1 Tax=Zoogloea sp. TaxID=49181 RepID=UPI002621AEAD|nr:PEP-CTERM sorting domain-containing protein [Zoogloea sp.]MDD3352746.1 PEP-CTERM sorting domain-containing protein [Zoogloea sp.]